MALPSEAKATRARLKAFGRSSSAAFRHVPLSRTKPRKSTRKRTQNK